MIQLDENIEATLALIAQKRRDLHKLYNEFMDQVADLRSYGYDVEVPYVTMSAYKDAKLPFKVKELVAAVEAFSDPDDKNLEALIKELRNHMC